MYKNSSAQIFSGENSPFTKRTFKVALASLLIVGVAGLSACQGSGHNNGHSWPAKKERRGSY